MSQNQQNQTNQTHDDRRAVINIQADVVVTEDGNSLVFRLRAGNKDSEDYVKNETIICPPGEALYKIHFHIDDKDCGYNLKFDRHNPIRATNGRDCPESDGIETNQLKNDDTKDRLLVIQNCNSECGPVCFALLFEDQDSGQKLPPYDPIIDNGGGGHPIFR